MYIAHWPLQNHPLVYLRCLTPVAQFLALPVPSFGQSTILAGVTKREGRRELFKSTQHTPEALNKDCNLWPKGVKVAELDLANFSHRV